MRRFLTGLIWIVFITFSMSAQNTKRPTESHELSRKMPREAIICESRYGVDETIEGIKKNLAELKIPVFALFDHQKNAEEVGLALPPTKVIVFGAPAVGTKLMQENPAISLELPLKISVYEDSKGKVWMEYLDMQQVASRYSMENNPIIENMQILLRKIVSHYALSICENEK